MFKRPLLVALLMGFMPVSARGPVDREPVIAGVRYFMGPRPGFDAVDIDLIGRARSRIDMAAYVMSDRAIIEALIAAARRGVKVRLYLDPEQNAAREAEPRGRLGDLIRTPGVDVRLKNSAGDYMHLKAYQVDGRYLRSGAANFSFSGERRQDNDIVIVDSVDAAAAFAARFDEIWARRDNSKFAP